MADMKQMYPSVTAAAAGGSGGIEMPPPKHGHARVMHLMAERGAHPVPPSHDAEAKVGDTEQFRMVAKLLARESHHIADIIDVNDPALTQNVRLLRAMPSASESSWDSCCCVRGEVLGSRVPGSRVATSKKH